MPGPWEQYQADATPQEGPWAKYGQAATKAPAAPAPLSATDKFLSKLPDIPGAQKGGPIDYFVRGMADPSIPADQFGGKVAEWTGSPEAGYAANVGFQAAPMILGGAVGKIASPPIQDTAKRLMGSALKPNTEQWRTGKAAKAIDTMLNEGISVSKGGIAKLKDKIGALNNEIASMIKGSPATVDKNAVANELQDTLKKFEKQVTPQSDTASIQAAWDDFVNHPLLSGQSRIPVELAQEMKQGTYRSLGDKAYGELKGASIEAQKTLARGLKEQIAKEVPGVDMLNRSESELLNALTPAEHRVMMDMNKNPGGLAWLVSNPKEAIGFLADRSPAFKSMIARMLYSGSETIPKTAGQVAGAAYGAGLGQPKQRAGQIPPPP